MKKKEEMTRRDFLRFSSAIAVGMALSQETKTFAQPPSSQGKRVSANEKIVLGFIGVAGRGTGLLDWFRRHDDVEVGAICDVYEPHRNAAVQRAGGKARAYHDFRDLLDQKDLDAVVIATPPHWHALITIYACQAGKDVYVEKPMCLYPAEARAMVKAAREHRRVTQVGTQIHAGENYRRVVEIVRSGLLGKITIVRNIFTLNEAPEGIGRTADTPPPPGLDWDLWLGPAPKVPFNPSRFFGGKYRYFWEYVMSWLHEMGPHIIDLPVWALQLGPPLAVSASGGKFAIEDMSTIPDTLEVTFEYPNLVMTWHHSAANSFNFDFGGPPDRGRRLGVMFHGTNATLLADYDTHKWIPEGDRGRNPTFPPPSLPRSPGHEREFLDCIKTRQQPSCSVEYHYNVAIALNLGHIAYKVGRKIRWDDAEGKIIGDKSADYLVKPQYRAPWKLPL